jgi:uncharacterized membrane protein
MFRAVAPPLSDVTGPSEPPVNSPSGWERIAPLLIAVMMGGYALLFGWLSLSAYWAYSMHALDMGNMGQAAWNTIHGHLFAFTNMRLPYNIEAWRTTTRLSFHVEALFPVISLAYVVYPHPESLLVLQTVAIALGAVPAYLLARDVLRSTGLALVFALAYLLYPTVEALNLYEFHPVSLATPLLLFAFLFAYRHQYVPFLLCSASAMGTKEEIGLVVGMFGLYIAFVQKERRIGLLTFVVGFGWSLFAALVIEKYFRQLGTVTYMASRYGYLCGGADATGQVHCHGFHGPIHTVLHDPGAILKAVFVWPKVGYLRYLLAPVGYTALLAPLALLLAAPTLALNLLSQDFHMYSGVGDNSAEIAAVVVIAGILGTARLRGWLARRIAPGQASLVVGVYIVASALWNQHVNGFTPLGAAYSVPARTAHQHLADRFVDMIPASAAVSTQDQLDPHLSSRRYLYLFEDVGTDPPLRPADYILLDVAAPTYPLPSYQLHDRAMQLLKSGWGVRAADDGLILLRRGLHRSSIPTGFYRFALAGGTPIPHRIDASAGALDVLGYAVQRTDLSNHRIPNLAYTVFFRPSRLSSVNEEPIVYERMGRELVGCASQPLGLAWFPTSRWTPGSTYQVPLPPLETNWNVPGTVNFQLEIRPVPGEVNHQPPSCAFLWLQHLRQHTVTWNAGSMSLDF